MNKDLTDIPEAEKKDYAYAVFKGAIGAVPLAGDVLGEVFALIVAPPIEKRRDEWILSIAQDLLNLRSQIEDFDLEDLSNNESFITTTLHATQAAIRSHQEEKLEALRNAVLNSALPNPPEEDLQQIFITMIDELTSWHLRILKLFKNPRASVGERSFGAQEDLLLFVYPELQGKKEFYDLICADLGTKGLASLGLRTMMTPQGVLSPRLSTIGNQFLRFISSPPQLSRNTEDA